MREKPPKRSLSVVGNPAESVATGLSPPSSLGKPGRDLWRRIQAEYVITDAGGRTVLGLICEACDRAEALRKRIDQDGEVIVTRNGLRAHPGLREEASCRSYIVRGLSRLGCLDEPLKPMGRPSHALGWEGYYGGRE